MLRLARFNVVGVQSSIVDQVLLTLLVVLVEVFINVHFNWGSLELLIFIVEGGLTSKIFIAKHIHVHVNGGGIWDVRDVHVSFLLLFEDEFF